MSIITIIEELIVRRITVIKSDAQVTGVQPEPTHTLPILDVDVTTLTLNDPRRWHYTGRVGDYGEREVIDLRTRRRGVNMNDCGFVPGAYICDDGRIGYDHPSDNPFWGCNWS